MIGELLQSLDELPTNSIDWPNALHPDFANILYHLAAKHIMRHISTTDTGSLHELPGKSDSLCTAHSHCATLPSDLRGHAFVLCNKIIRQP